MLRALLNDLLPSGFDPGDPPDGMTEPSGHPDRLSVPSHHVPYLSVPSPSVNNSHVNIPSVKMTSVNYNMEKNGEKYVKNAQNMEKNSSKDGRKTEIMENTNFNENYQEWNFNNIGTKRGGNSNSEDNMLTDVQIDIYVSQLIKNSIDEDITNIMLFPTQLYSKCENVLFNYKDIEFTTDNTLSSIKHMIVIDNDLIPDIELKNKGKMIFLISDSKRNHFFAAILNGNILNIFDSEKSKNRTTYALSELILVKFIKALRNNDATIEINIMNCRQQLDETSCGLYVVAFIEEYINNGDCNIDLNYDFESLRKRIDDTCAPFVNVLKETSDELTHDMIIEFIVLIKKIAESRRISPIALIPYSAFTLALDPHTTNWNIKRKIHSEFGNTQSISIIETSKSHTMCILYSSKDNSAKIFYSLESKVPLSDNELTMIKSTHERTVKTVFKNARNIQYSYEKVVQQQSTQFSKLYMLNNIENIILGQSLNTHSVNIPDMRLRVFNTLTGIKLWSHKKNKISNSRYRDNAESEREILLNSREMLDTATFDKVSTYLLNNSGKNDCLLVKSMWTGEVLQNMNANILHPYGTDEDIVENAFINYNQSTQYKKIIIPLREAMHFWVIEMNTQTMDVKVFDSLPQKHIKITNTNKFIRGLVHKITDIILPTPMNQWNPIIVPVTHQRDGTSCGLFSLNFVDHLLTKVALKDINPEQKRKEIADLIFERDAQTGRLKPVEIIVGEIPQNMKIRDTAIAPPLITTRREDKQTVNAHKTKSVPKVVLKKTNKASKTREPDSLFDDIVHDEDSNVIIKDHFSRPYNTYECDDDDTNVRNTDSDKPTKCGRDPLTREIVDYLIDCLINQYGNSQKIIAFKCDASRTFADISNVKHQLSEVNADGYYIEYNNASLENFDNLFIPISNSSNHVFLALFNSSLKSVSMFNSTDFTVSEIKSAKTTVYNILRLFKLCNSKKELTYSIENCAKSKRKNLTPLFTVKFIEAILLNDNVNFESFQPHLYKNELNALMESFSKTTKKKEINSAIQCVERLNEAVEDIDVLGENLESSPQFMTPNTPTTKNRSNSSRTTKLGNPDTDLSSMTKKEGKNTPVRRQSKANRSDCSGLSRKRVSSPRQEIITVSPIKKMKKPIYNESGSFIHSLETNELSQLLGMWKSFKTNTNKFVDQNLLFLLQSKNCNLAKPSIFDGRLKINEESIHQHLSIFEKNNTRFILPFVKFNRSKIIHCFVICVDNDNKFCDVHQLLRNVDTKQIDDAVQKVMKIFNILFPYLILTRRDIEHNSEKMENSYSTNSPIALLNCAINFTTNESCFDLDFNSFHELVVSKLKLCCENQIAKPTNLDSSPQQTNRSRKSSVISVRSARSMSVISVQSVTQSRAGSVESFREFTSRNQRITRSRSKSIPLSEIAVISERMEEPLIMEIIVHSLKISLNENKLLSWNEFDQLLQLLIEKSATSTLIAKSTLIKKRLILKNETADKYFHNLSNSKNAETVIFPIMKRNRNKLENCFFIGYCSITECCTVCFTREGAENDDNEWIYNIIRNTIKFIYSESRTVKEFKVVLTDFATEKDSLEQQLLLFRHCITFATNENKYCVDNFDYYKYRTHILSLMDDTQSIIPHNLIDDAQDNIPQNDSISSQTELHLSHIEPDNDTSKIKLTMESFQSIDRREELCSEIIDAALCIIAPHAVHAKVHCIDSKVYSHFLQNKAILDSMKVSDCKNKCFYIPLKFVDRWIFVKYQPGYCFYIDSKDKINTAEKRSMGEFIKQVFGDDNIYYDDQSDRTIKDDPREGFNSGLLLIFNAFVYATQCSIPSDGVADLNMIRQDVKKWISESNLIEFKDQTTVPVPISTRKRQRETTLKMEEIKMEKNDKKLIKFLQENGYSGSKKIEKDLIAKISAEDLRFFMEKTAVSEEMLDILIEEKLSRYSKINSKLVSSSFYRDFVQNTVYAKDIQLLKETNCFYVIPFMHRNSWYACCFDNTSETPVAKVYYNKIKEGKESFEEKLYDIISILKESETDVELTFDFANSAKSKESKNSFVSFMFNLHFALNSIHPLNKGKYSTIENKYRLSILRDILESPKIIILESYDDNNDIVNTSSYMRPSFTNDMIKELDDINSPLTEEIVNAYICSIQADNALPLPLEAFDALGPIQGFLLDRRGILIIPFKRHTNYGLAVLTNQKARIYDKEVNANVSELYNKLSDICEWYGRNRCSCSLEKNYPSTLHPISSLAYITSLTHSFCTYSKNLVHNFDDFSVKQVIKRMITKDKFVEYEDDTNTWKYLDEVCREKCDSQVKIRFSHANNVYVDNSRANHISRTVRKKKIIPETNRFHIGNPLPDIFELPPQIHCKHCSALLYENYESSKLCCKDGLINLEEQTCCVITIPELLKFKEDIHKCSSSAPYRMLGEINRENAFAFRTTKAVPRSMFPRGGTIPIKLSGGYKVSPVCIDPDGNSKSFSCLNICNQSKAIERDFQTGKYTDSDRADMNLFKTRLQKILRQYCPLLNFYKTAIEMYKEELERAKLANEKPLEILMNIVDSFELRKAVDEKVLREHVKEVRGAIGDESGKEKDAPMDEKSKKSLKKKQDEAMKKTLEKIGITSTHDRNLNAPSTEEPIAYFYTYEKGKEPSYDELNNGIRVFLKNPRRKPSIPHMAAYRDAAMFPLIFPKGNTLYHRRLRRKENPKYKGKSENQRFIVSRKENYRYFMNRRDNRKGMDHPVFGLGAVAAEFALHVNDQCENDKYAFIRKKAKEMEKMRFTTPSAHMKYIEKKFDQMGYELGVKIELPSSFEGSRKNIDKRFYSSMALMRKFGKADVFLTATGNPNWPEIEALKLSEHEDWQYMSHDVGRIFHAKLKELMDDIVKREVLGPVVYLVGSIEYQKRGMPHIHTIFKLEEPLNTKERIDKIICAEIPEVPPVGHPDHDKMLKLFELVKKHHIHGPCDGKNHMSCRKDWKGSVCRKKFPKPISDETEIPTDDYPKYRRRMSSNVICFGSKNNSAPRLATNQHVVPYNPALLYKFQSHINVEAITGIMNFRYIFKYINKGYDEIMFTMKDPREHVGKGVRIREPKDGNGRPKIDFDEIDAFQHARYIDQHEASWNLCGFKKSFTTHTVIPLVVHLEGEQSAAYEEDDDEVERAHKISKATSRFIDYMIFMRSVMATPEHKKLTFEELNMAMKYKKDEGFSAYKKAGQAEKNVAYIVPVHPTQMEKYALYVLARKRAGYTSFLELRTDQNSGTVYPSFEAAARGMGLLKDEEEWDYCMQLGINTQLAYACRVLFATILSNCRVPDPRAFWEKYKKNLMNPSNNQYSTLQREQHALRHIKRMLKGKGKKYKDYNLPKVIDDPRLQARRDARRKAESEKYCFENKRKLNYEQEKLIDRLIKCVENPSDPNRLFLVTGSGGCGKTFLYTYFIHWCIANDHTVQPVASTGIASTLLHEGLTAHTSFKIPLDAAIFKKPNLNITKGRGRKLAETEVIIWDEVAMTDIHTFDYVNRTLQTLSVGDDQDKPFGNKVVLIGGDFKQILPILKYNQTDVLSVTINNYELFEKFQHFKLTKNMRLRPDQKKYRRYIEGVGNGMRNFDSKLVDIPEKLVLLDMKELIDFVFPKEVLNIPEEMSKRAILTVTNATCKSINEKILELIDGEQQTLLGISSLPDEIDNTGLPFLSLDQIESDKYHDLPPHNLNVKIGCILMLMRNIDIENKLCNGTKLELVKIVKEDNNPHTILLCKNLSISDPRKKLAFIPRITINYEDKQNGVVFSRRQFPVKLCYGMTINKSQGQTLDKVGLCMATPAFSHGQMYVAVSRVRDEDSIRVYVPPECQAMNDDGETYSFVRNVVEYSLLNEVGEDLTGHIASQQASRDNSIVPYGVIDNIGGESTDDELFKDNESEKEAAQSIDDLSQRGSQRSGKQSCLNTAINQDDDYPSNAPSQVDHNSQNIPASQHNSQQIINENNDDDNDDEEFEQMIKDFWNEPTGNKNNEPLLKKRKIDSNWYDESEEEIEEEDNFENYDNEDDQNRPDTDEEDNNEKRYKFVHPEECEAEISTDDDDLEEILNNDSDEE